MLIDNEQPTNGFPVIVVTDDGIVILVNELHPSNANKPIDVTWFPMITSVICVLTLLYGFFRTYHGQAERQEIPQDSRRKRTYIEMP